MNAITYFAGAVLVAVGATSVMGCETESPVEMPDYEPGQVWSFRLEAGEPEATLTVLRVESIPNLGDVVHISVSAVRVPQGVTRVGHLPMSRDAMDRSVLDLVRVESSPPDLSGYQAWRNAKGGIFTTTVSDAMAFVREAISRQ